MCLLEFEEEETAIEMPCHHLFHSNCILPWLSKVLFPFSQPSPCLGPSPQASSVDEPLGWGVGSETGEGKGRELGAGDGCFELMKTRGAGTLHCFSQTNSCPLCRHELPTDDDTYEEHKRDKVGGWASGGGGHRAP